MQPEVPRKPRRRWLQFGTRTLLLTTMFLSVSLGFYMQRVRRQKEAVQEIRDLGGWVYYDYQERKRSGSSYFEPTAEPTLPRSVLDWFGEDFFFDVAACSYANAGNAHARLDAESLQPLREFPELQELYLRDGQATDEALEFIGTLKSLKILYLWDSPDVTDAGIAHLAGLSRLEKFAVTNSQIGDEALKTLGRLPKMSTLMLRFNHFSNRGLVHLQDSRNLRQLARRRGH